MHLEMNGNREVIVEGCRNILEYDDHMIKISFKNMSAMFLGRNLSIKCLDTNSLVINGFIISVEFIT
ncbi:MAG: YabP/YqfC family sporulation protein [Candidatus Paraimprobicoccus trichonymphae]|uniref:YabP/YqfC family sporulation protein n=1 Tax=Candidatus Paraimprobicoccus trichonymphae TaxID=3033793 RepID=A0AA48L1M1_9FIRM|nr:MAG: YabP/YqfC family sporulation protein [Candidatus Paraimprobicoccus trichonymphae]